jgi:hypothetical protein
LKQQLNDQGGAKRGGDAFCRSLATRISRERRTKGSNITV